MSSYHKKQPPDASAVLLDFLTAQRLLGVSRSTLYRLMWHGDIPGYKVGSTWRFYRADLDQLIQRGKQP